MGSHVVIMASCDAATSHSFRPVAYWFPRRAFAYAPLAPAGQAHKKTLPSTVGGLLPERIKLCHKEMQGTIFVSNRVRLAN